ncbi:MAG: EamA family transporter [Candidatus Coatesbacteria bacterium]
MTARWAGPRPRPARGAIRRGRVALAFLAVCVVWGTTFLAIKTGLAWLPPLTLGGAQCGIAGLLLLAWLAARGGLVLDARDIRRGIVAGALFFPFGNGMVFAGTDRVPSGLAALLVATIPLFTAIFGWTTGYLSRPGWGQGLGLALGLGGVAWLAGPFGPGGPLGPADPRVPCGLDPAGALLLLAGSACWGVGSIYTGPAAPPTRSSPLARAAVQVFGGGILMLAAGGATGEWGRIRWDQMTVATVGSLAYLIVFGSLVAFVSYTYLLSVADAGWASTYALVNPVVALFVGWWLAGEALSLRTVAAAAVIIAGVALLTLVEGPRAGGGPSGRRAE